MAVIRNAITKENAGKTFVVKDFLNEDNDDLTTVRNVNDKRRKCDTIFMQEISPDFQKLLTSSGA